MCYFTTTVPAKKNMHTKLSQLLSLSLQSLTYLHPNFIWTGLRAMIDFPCELLLFTCMKQ